MAGKNVKSKSSLSLVLLGKTGAGKSATGNTILRREAFISKNSASSVTQDVLVKSGTVCGYPLTVYDTPGFSSTDLTEEEIGRKCQRIFQECESGPCVFLLVIKAERYTEEDRKAVENIVKHLGEERIQKTCVLFTRGDELEDEKLKLEELINGIEALKKLVQNYEDRYHVFNNKEKNSSDQVQKLLRKILKISLTKTTAPKHGRQNPVRRQHVPVHPVTIVLLGKTGFGKSAAGNLIVGQKMFKSEFSMNSQTMKSIKKDHTVTGQIVSVVDTPGFFNTVMNPEEIMNEIGRSVYLSSPGPHAFLIVFPVKGCFTEEEMSVPKRIEMLFGKEVFEYSIILFTHGDQLETSVDKLINKSSKLRSVVDQCGGRCHVFNNKDLNNRDQVTELLQKIDTMIQQNGGGHYTHQMYQDALRCRQEEEEERRREEEERKQREEEERRREEEERKQREEEERRREEEEGRREKEERKQREEEWRLRQATGIGRVIMKTGEMIRSVQFSNQQNEIGEASRKNTEEKFQVFHCIASFKTRYPKLFSDLKHAGPTLACAVVGAEIGLMYRKTKYSFVLGAVVGVSVGETFNCFLT